MARRQEMSGARSRQAKYRSEKIMNAALELFCAKGIEETSIDEIAEKAEVGSATIYRYYETKAELAIQSGVTYWKKVVPDYLDMSGVSGYEDMTGIEQLECIMDGLMRIFEHERGFLKYLQEFDVFVRKYGISSERLKEYEEYVISQKAGVMAAVEKGRRDGTLSFEWSSEQVCYSLAHSIFGLMKKLAWNGSMLALDEQNGMELQVKIAVSLLIRGLATGKSEKEKGG